MNYLKILLLVSFSFLLNACAGSMESNNINIEETNPTGDSRCKEVRTIQLSGVEFINTGDSYSKVKSMLVDQLLLDAVEQVVGVEIRRQANTKIELVNNKLSDEFKEMSVEKAKGYILSYSIPDNKEKVTKRQGQDILNVSLIADVCIPNDRFSRDIVAIGDVVWAEKGNVKFQGVKDLVSTAYFENSKFNIVKKAPETVYHDWVLSGRLVSTSANVQKDYGRGLARSFLNSLALNGRSMATDYNSQVVHVSVTTYMQVENALDKRILSSTSTLEEKYSVEFVNKGLDRQIDLLIEKSIVEATRGVFEKLTKVIQ